MASTHEVHVKISSAKDLKNVNWRHGPNKPYAVVWVDPNRKVSTKVDSDGDTCPSWDDTLVVPLTGRVDDEDATLCIDVVHAGDEEDTKKLIGSARLKLIEVLEEAGIGESVKRSLTLKRPSGRPQGKLDVRVTINQTRYYPPGAYYAPHYGASQASPPATRDFGYPYGPPPPPPGGYPYQPTAPPPPPGGYPYQSTAPPPSGYPYNPYNAAPPTASSYSYGQGTYGGQEAGYYVGEEKKKKSGKFGGMGTGLAVGAVAGVLGGIALTEGAEALEDHIADDAAKRVEDDLGYDPDDF